MDAEERVRRVRDRVDQALDHVRGGLLDEEVVAGERHDPRIRLEARGACQAVRLQAGAGDDEVEGAGVLGHLRLDPGHRERDPHFVAHGVEPGDLGVVLDAPAGGEHVVAERLGQGDEVDDRGVRGVEGEDTADVGLDLAHLVPVEECDVRHAVGARTLVDLLQPVDLERGVGDDELAALVVGDAVDGGVLDEHLHTPPAQLRLEAARLVVEAGVHDAGVVAGLVGGQMRFLLEDGDGGLGFAEGELAGDGGADDASADDGDA